MDDELKDVFSRLDSDARVAVAFASGDAVRVLTELEPDHGSIRAEVIRRAKDRPPDK